MRHGIIIAAQMMLMTLLILQQFQDGSGSHTGENSNHFNHELLQDVDMRDVGVLRREVKKPTKNTSNSTKKFEKLNDVMEARQSQGNADSAFVTLYQDRDWQGESREIFLEPRQCFPLFTRWAGRIGSMKIPAGVCVNLYQISACGAQDRGFFATLWGTLRPELEMNTAKGLCWEGVHSIRLC